MIVAAPVIQTVLLCAQRLNAQDAGLPFEVWLDAFSFLKAADCYVGLRKLAPAVPPPPPLPAQPTPQDDPMNSDDGGDFTDDEAFSDALDASDDDDDNDDDDDGDDQ
jgi:hypothetical protein